MPTLDRTDDLKEQGDDVMNQNLSEILLVIGDNAGPRWWRRTLSSRRTR